MRKIWKFLDSPLGLALNAGFWVLVNLLWWGFSENLTKVEWASWVQAIGSVGAITFAYFIGKQQAAATLQSVRDADRLAALRRYDSILAVADAALNYAKEIAKSFAPKQASYMHLRMTHSDQLMQNMMDSLQIIPAHEMGSYHAVSAFLTLRNAMHDFRGNVKRALAKFETSDGMMEPVIEFDRTPIDLCIKKMNQCIEALRAERALLT
jgi:hypothetical protein